MRTISLVKNSDWADKFALESRRLQQMLANNLVTIHHIGSTAIPGIYAKPVIDMILVVTDIHALDIFADKFFALGYQARGEHGLPGRRFYQKGEDLRSHHLHAYNLGDREIWRHLCFRDYLKAHQVRALQYQQLKLTLAAKFSHSAELYCNGKDKLIKEIEQEALIWAQQNKLIPA